MSGSRDVVDTAEAHGASSELGDYRFFVGWRSDPFFFDQRFATLKDVVAHDTSVLNLTLTDRERDDLIEYLTSLSRASLTLRAATRKALR